MKQTKTVHVRNRVYDEPTRYTGMTPAVDHVEGRDLKVRRTGKYTMKNGRITLIRETIRTRTAGPVETVYCATGMSSEAIAKIPFTASRNWSTWSKTTRKSETASRIKKGKPAILDGIRGAHDEAAPLPESDKKTDPTTQVRYGYAW